MKRSLCLFTFLCCLFAYAAPAQAQQEPRILHSQNMHQYIVHQAWQLLQREKPGLSKRLEKHIGQHVTGTRPWEEKTIMTGAWREDCEDAVFGYGTANKDQWPDIDLSRKSGVSGQYYMTLEGEIKDNADFRAGLTTAAHFWDPFAPNNYLFKENIRLEGTWALSVLNTENQSITIRPMHNAWDKFQRILRPNGEIAIRDKWWESGAVYYYDNGASNTTLPIQQHAWEEVAIRYSSLAHLMNTGECRLEIPGRSINATFVLTKEQRQRYVWEMLGRACHLLADMSVPAHTHRDLHMGNLNITNNTAVGTLHIAVEDADSYENWLQLPTRAYWNAENIQSGLLDLLGIGDPLYHLFFSMRELAASFASDDFDGQGPVNGLPRLRNDIPYRFPSESNYDANKTAMMLHIRDNTLPYAIRATATLLAWFAEQLDMPEDFAVYVTGSSGYQDFFYRPDFYTHFPSFGTLSGTRFMKETGDILSLRAHINPHPITDSKFISWDYGTTFRTEKHQVDDYVEEAQPDVYCKFSPSENHITPTLQVVNHEHHTVITSDYPTFLDPWLVDPGRSTEFGLHQAKSFEKYRPITSTSSNGGIFLRNYSKHHRDLPHYSIRASKIWDAKTLTHKWPRPDVGDYVFERWEAINTELYEEPLNLGTDPAFANPEQYDTRAVNFLNNTAILSALVKAHRQSIGSEPPSKSNSQRKVARTRDGMYHAVYESAGRIWYLRSDDRGNTWMPEIPISDELRHATRPSIAVGEHDAWISYVCDGKVEVMRVAGGIPGHAYSAPLRQPDLATPAIAALPVDPASPEPQDLIMLVWEDSYELRFAVLSDWELIVDNQLLVQGQRRATSVDQPRYPSIAASVEGLVPGTAADQFHLAWIENGSIFHTELLFDRSVHPPLINGWRMGSTAQRNLVHDRNGSVGIAYPARHAPSIAVSEAGTIHVAFDVLSTWSPWPGNTASATGGSTSIAPRNMFAIRERGSSLGHNPTWNTTATIVGTNNPLSRYASPTIGTRKAPGSKGSKSTSVRVTFNDSASTIRGVRIDGNLTSFVHADGVDPNLTVWSADQQGMIDVFSTAQNKPYDWAFLSSGYGLNKESELQQVRMREILLGNAEAIGILGVADVRMVNKEGAVSAIDWNPDHDTLQLGTQSSVAAKMRSASFLAEYGNTLRFRVQRYAERMADATTSFVIRLRDAITGELIKLIDLPLGDLNGSARLEAMSVDLSPFAGRSVYLDVDVADAPDHTDVTITDRYAVVDPQRYAEELERAVAATTDEPLLLKNHPNPFNPSTTISFSLPSAQHVRLAVYDLLGHEVRCLVDTNMPAGEHAVNFDGNGLATGIYMYQLHAGGRTITRTMHLVK